MRSASGRTTVPMSRPTMTVSWPCAAWRCTVSMAARTSACWLTIGTARSIRGSRRSSVTSRRPMDTRSPVASEPGSAARTWMRVFRARRATAASSAGSNARLQGGQRHRPVEEPGVDEAGADPLGQGAADGALSRARRSIDRNPEPGVPFPTATDRWTSAPAVPPRSATSAGVSGRQAAGSRPARVTGP